MTFLGIRNIAGMIAGHLAATASRTLGRGSGGMIGGRVASQIAPNLLRDLTRRMQVVIITGTNGKSTTTRMIAEAVAASGCTVATNRGGDNMLPGVLAAILEAPKAEVAVLEVDEMWVAKVANEVNPNVFVFLNLSRDQLDRVGEIATIERRLRTAVGDHPDATVITNIDDPLMTSAAWDSRRPVWVAAGQGWSGDSLTAPRTGGIIVYGGTNSSNTNNSNEIKNDDERALTSDSQAQPTSTIPPAAIPPASGQDTNVWWRAVGLDADMSANTGDTSSFARPYPNWSWTASADNYQPGVAMQVHGPDGSTEVIINLPGRANRSNACQALAAAHALGVELDVAARGIAAVSSVAGRYANINIEGRNVRLLLAKNPAGWQESLTMLRPGAALVVGINGQVADGVDLSWLWDVEFSQLASRKVWACGERGADLNVRLHYAGVNANFVADPVAAILATPPGDVDVLLNYTSFRDTRAALRKRGYEV